MKNIILSFLVVSLFPMVGTAAGLSAKEIYELKENGSSAYRVGKI